jgi:phosphate starvation-inducible PhoH-like protein
MWVALGTFLPKYQFFMRSSKKSYPLVNKKHMGKGKKQSKYLSDLEEDFSVYGISPSSYGSSYLDDDFPLSKEKFLKPSLQLKPRNENQKLYMQYLEDVSYPIIIASGPAGTGKTMMPAHIAMQKLQNNDIQKIIITRPAVSVEEQHGFLPGTLEEKMEPWLRPVFDVFYQYATPTKIQKLMQNMTIEICPLAYMRGRTFEHSWIIADEAQNMTPNQMLMLLTRIGNHSKMIITGDERQHDRGFEHNGLKDFLERLKTKEDSVIEIKHIQFTYKDVERHKVIPKILKLYDQH